MRIGVDACCWANNRGYGRFTREFLRALVQVDEKNEYLFFCDPETSELIDLPKHAKITVPTTQNVNRAASAGSYRTPRDLFRFSEAVFRQKLDWFFSPSVYTYFPVLNRCKVAVTIHDTIADEYPHLIFPDRRARWFWYWKVFVARQQASLLFTVSEFAKSAIRKTFRTLPRQIHVLLEAPDSAYLKKVDPATRESVLRRLNLSETDRFFIYVGGISPHKNVGLLADVFSDPEFNDCKLLLVGDYQTDGFYSDYPNLRKLISQKNSEARIFFTGFLPDEEIAALYRAAVALVLPSYAEGFGLPAVEAMAAGLPVIATCRSAIPEIAPCGALFFSPDDRDALKKAMITLLHNQPIRDQIRLAGKVAVNKLSWEESARNFVKILECH